MIILKFPSYPLLSFAYACGSEDGLTAQRRLRRLQFLLVTREK